MGELAATATSRQDGSFKSEFKYLPGWLDDPKAFALDPVSLPLDSRGRPFHADLFHPPLGVFEDALLDDWGRRLLSAALKLDCRPATRAELLLRMRGVGSGALIFTASATAPATVDTLQSAALTALLGKRSANHRLSVELV